jgi:D-alanyl-D-alanine dipeptidase
MPPLLADPVISDIEVLEDGSPIVDLRDHGVSVVLDPPELPLLHQRPTGTRPAPDRLPLPHMPHLRTRLTLAERLATANADLPSGIRLLVVEGLRPRAAQQAIHDAYRDELAAEHPFLTAHELDLLVSRFVAPPAVAPHVCGAAVDLTLTSHDGPLDLGTAIDATPEQSGGACYFESPSISPEARRHREILSRALTGVGLVNYPTEWWHWSFGDRYWAHAVGHPFAIHGPVEASG